MCGISTADRAVELLLNRRFESFPLALSMSPNSRIERPSHPFRLFSESPRWYRSDEAVFGLIKTYGGRPIRKTIMSEEKKADVTIGFGSITFHDPTGKGKDVVRHTAPMMAIVPSEDGIEVVMVHDKPETKD